MKYLSIILTLLFFFVGCDKVKTGDESVLTINPVEINFPVVFIGNSNLQEVRLINSGTSSITIKKDDIKISYILENGEVEPESKEFTLEGIELPLTIKKGATKTFKIKYSPKRAVKYKNIYLITNSDADEGKHIVTDIYISRLVPLLGTSTELIRFTDITQGNIGEKMVSLTNVGSSDLIIEAGALHLKEHSEPSLSLEGTGLTNSVNDNKITLCPYNSDNDSCLKEFEFKVKFAPENTSTRSGKLVIKSNDPSSPKEIPIRTNAVECILDIYPSSNSDIIDMGARKIEREYIKDLTLRNNGTNICKIKDMKLIDDDDSVYTLIDAPETFDYDLMPGERLRFKIKFLPPAVAPYTAKLKLDSNDPRGNREIAITGEGRVSTGPTAICNPTYAEVEPAIDNPRIHPNSIITLDGTQSTGAGLRYSWRKVQGPAGSTAMPTTPTQAATKYFVDLTGEHILELTVTDEEGETDTCRVELYGLTGNSLHVELFWDASSDVDLHLRKPNGNNGDWFKSSDCYYGNCTTGAHGAGVPCESNPTICQFSGGGTCENGVCTGGEPNPDGLEWGVAGRDDNPRLDRDDMSGTGPENINIAAPFDSQGKYYTVAVDYFSAEGASNGTTATVRVYCNGDMQFNGTAKLEDTKWWWYAANIKWVGDGEDGTCEVIPINRVQHSNP